MGDYNQAIRDLQALIAPPHRLGAEASTKLADAQRRVFAAWTLLSRVTKRERLVIARCRAKLTRRLECAAFAAWLGELAAQLAKLQ